MIGKGIKRLIYSDLKSTLTVIYENDERKEFPMTQEEYLNFLKTGKSEIIK